MAFKRVLVIPHIGSAYGHLIRTAALIETKYSDCDVVVSVPESALAVARRYLPDNVRLLTYPLRPTVTNPSGRLDTEGFLALLRSDRQIAESVSPDLIVGDPGIRAALTAETLGIPWVALTHGCYLPMPPAVHNDRHLRELAQAAWNCATRALDHLVTIGSAGTIQTWADLRCRGQVLIPNTSDAEPCEVGTHVGLLEPSYGFSQHKPVRCLLTLSSSGDVQPDDAALRAIVARWGQLTVVGVADGPSVAGVEYLGHAAATKSLIGTETVVITHGGHGTLKAARQAAIVLAVPSDIDQLCNTLVASAYWGVNLAVGDSWRVRLLSSAPFKRYADWPGLVEFLETEGPSLHRVAGGRANTLKATVS